MGYVIVLIDGGGLIAELPASVANVEIGADGLQTTTLKTPPIPKAQLLAMKSPKSIGWSVTVRKGGKILGRSPMQHYEIRVVRRHKD